ncbi:helix-turn-helix transcriptional regulator [Rhizorhabdus argentea]|uniref:helix-turn-helix transcriptional regulator n=1 Tax=Rhizorhabdus argentea TaxID=1387174 RepID=UPI0030ED99B6
MKFTIQDENDLLTALYDGPFEQPLWTTFLDRLRMRVRANYTSLIFRPPHLPRSSPIELFSGESSLPELRQLYRQEIYKRDPLPYLALREGRVYALSELLDSDVAEHQQFIDELLTPSGSRQMRTVRVSEPSGVDAWLTIARDNPDFTAADSALLSALATHLRRALRNYVEIERGRAHANISANAIEKLNFGWLSLDSGGRIIEASSRAQRLLQHCPALRIGRRRHLTAVSTELDRELRSAIKLCADNPETRPRALHISRDPWIDMLLVAIQTRVDEPLSAPVAIAYLQGDNHLLSDRHQQIADLFGLLPSEARLALALCRGLTLTEAAADLGLTVETARNYSKKIYAKMGARGQSDLIRYILASVLALA